MKKKGFTLTELIAAIVILSIIITIGVVTYTEIRKNVLNKQYNNLVTYLETKAGNYANDTGELNVTVERLIETGYVDGGVQDPRDNSSMNCYLFDSKYDNGNYVAKLDGRLELGNGKCNSYVVKKEIQICVDEENNDKECDIKLKEWYNKNVTLKVLIGGNEQNDAKITWKAGGETVTSPTYKTKVASINKGTYTVSVSYEENNLDGTKKVFEGSDTVPINIDVTKPEVTKIEVNEADKWTTINKRVIVCLSDNNGSGIKEVAFYNTNLNKTCDDQGLPWVEYGSSEYRESLGNGTYRVCVKDKAGNISEDIEEPIKVEKVDVIKPSISNITKIAEYGDNGVVTLSATISDNESKILGYAITESNEEPTTWVMLNGAPESKEISKTIQKSGTYYIWVKDVAGNINKKEETITVKYKQITKVRYENIDGTWGDYSVVEEKKLEYGDNYTWSKNADTTYQRASVNSYTVTVSKTNEVSIYRNKYTCKIDYRLENADGSYARTTNVINTSLRHGATCEWTRNADTIYQRASFSQIITSDINTTIDVKRNTFTCTKQYRLENINGTWKNYTSDGFLTVRYGGSCSYEKTVTNYKGSLNGENDSKGTSSASNITSNQVLSISLYNNRYTISFDAQGGSGGQKVDVIAIYDADMPSITSTSPTKTGYAFAGWYDAISGGTQYYTASGASARNWNKKNNTTLYARWTANTYKVAFNSNGGSGSMSTQSFTYGSSKALTANAFTKTGYRFNSWNTKSDGSGTSYSNKESVSSLTSINNGTVTLYAQWEIATTTITFDPNGGTGGQSESVIAINGQKMPDILTTPPKKDNYIFQGWYDTPESSEGTMYYNSIGKSAKKWNKTSKTATLYARWIGKGKFVYYSNNDFVSGLENKTLTYSFYGYLNKVHIFNQPLEHNKYYIITYDYVSPTEYAVNEFHFGPYAKQTDGHYTISGVGKATTTLEHVERAYISLDTTEIVEGLGTYGNRSTPLISVTISNFRMGTGGYVLPKYGENYNLPTPVREGYDFVGWFTDYDGGTQVTNDMIVDNINSLYLYARWSPIKYNIQFDANGGTGSTANMSNLEYGKGYYLTYNGFSNSGHYFASWNTKSDGTGTAYGDGAYINNLTSTNGTEVKLYAQWAEYTYSDYDYDDTPSCGTKCQADFNSATYNNCSSNCPYYDGNGTYHSSGGTHDKMHDANVDLYKSMGIDEGHYDSSSGKWTDDNGNCLNCKS